MCSMALYYKKLRIVGIWYCPCSFHPLHCCLLFNSNFKLHGPAEKEAFNTLKSTITSAPVLTFPSQSSHFCLRCDTLNFTTGAVLSQAQADGTHQPVAFMSKGFLNAEHYYQIHDKEMLDIMCTLDEWHHFLKGAVEKFEILTDHWNLAYFCNAQKLNHWQVCWSLFLSHFNFSLCHQSEHGL